MRVPPDLKLLLYWTHSLVDSFISLSLFLFFFFFFRVDLILQRGLVFNISSLCFSLLSSAPIRGHWQEFDLQV